MINLTLMDYDELYHNCPIKPIIVNGMDVDSKEGRAELNSLLLTRYTGDTLSNVPKCGCGHLSGIKDLGRKCEVCGDVCETSLNRPVYPMIWMEAPVGINYFINPAVWLPLSKSMTIDKFNILEWLTCRNYVPPKGKIPGRAKRLERLGIERGLNYFKENFEFIMRSYIEAWNIRVPNQGREWFIAFCEILFQNPQLIFSRYLPFPCRTGFVFEANDSGNYMEKSIPHATNALMTIIGLDRLGSNVTIEQKEKKVINVSQILSQFYFKYTSEIQGGKPGTFRKNVIAGKVNSTARAVITSIFEPHEYDELHVPWGLALSLFRIHISNRLLKKGYTPKKIFKTLLYSSKSFTSEIDRVFDELIEMAGPKGIPVIFQRNPSLKRLSIQYLHIKKVLKDPRINSIRLSVLVIRGYNADFDGDEMNMYCPIDNNVRRRLSRLAPHLGLLDLNKPRNFASDVNLPDAAARLATNIILDGEEGI